MKVNSYQLTVISLLAAVFFCPAELTVKLEPIEASRFVYEPFSLQLEISGDTAELPNVPSGSGYSITGVFQEPDSGNILIEIIAEEPGILTVPPFAVSTSNESIQTPPLRLPISAPRRAREMDLSIRFSATRLVVDQPVRMDVVWTSKVPFTRSYELQLDLPLLRNPAWEVYALVPDVPEKERIGLPVNAQRVIARNAQTDDGFELGFSYQLIPRREGVYNSGAQLNCALMESKRSPSQYPSYFDNHFFSRPDTRDRYERIYLSADGPQLTARALPEEGRTVRYSGIVGDCAARAKLEPTDTVVGQPMLLTVTLTNLVFAKHIQNLPEATLDGIGPEFRITRDPIHISSTATSRTFTYIVRPLRSGLDTLPALSLDFFDPEQQAYRTVRTAPLAITVEPDGKQTVYTPSRKTDPLIPLTGIRNNRKESEPMMYAFLEFLTAHGWTFWFLPPLLWLLLRPWLRRRDRCRTDPAYARALYALRRFNRTVNTDEETSWKTYLADRFDLAAEAVTFEAVRPHLQHIDEELMQAVRDRFNAEETTRYAPPGTPEKRAAAVRKLVRRIEKAIPVLLLLIALLPARSDARPEPVERAAPADDLFEQALEIRAERPDEAAPLFTEAALEFEAEQRFFNAANSWFFAGENGRALA
ncbi:MAG: BatD family protein, partial [Kiritimatiellales bacterium]|nr:BatD family protein [Kiritimatiellales bacterium]